MTKKINATSLLGEVLNYFPFFKAEKTHIILIFILAFTSFGNNEDFQKFFLDDGNEDQQLKIVYDVSEMFSNRWNKLFIQKMAWFCLTIIISLYLFDNSLSKTFFLPSNALFFTCYFRFKTLISLFLILKYFFVGRFNFQQLIVQSDA